MDIVYSTRIIHCYNNLYLEGEQSGYIARRWMIKDWLLWLRLPASGIKLSMSIKHFFILPNAPSILPGNFLSSDTHQAEPNLSTPPLGDTLTSVSLLTPVFHSNPHRVTLSFIRNLTQCIYDHGKTWIWAAVNHSERPEFGDRGCHQFDGLRQHTV